MKRTLILLSLVAMISLLFLVPKHSFAAGKIKSTLITASYADPESLDPHSTKEHVSILPIQNIYEKLVSYKGTSIEIGPVLATSWNVSGDGKVWTFKLREGVNFHDGSPFDSEAVKYSFERLLTLNRGAAPLFSSIDKIETPDKYTAVFHLKNPFGPFLAILANMKGGYIMSPSWLKKHESDGDKGVKYAQNHTNGTGPFILQRWSPGQEIVLKRNEKYWRGWSEKKYSDTVVIKVIREEIGRRMALKSGEVDFLIRSISPEEFEKLKGDPNINTMVKTGLNVVYIGFNCSRPPMSNKKLRQAASYAFDYESAVKNIMSGSFETMQMIGPLSRNMWAHNPNVKVYRRDLDKAKELLKEAGYKPGELTLEVNHLQGIRWVEQMMQLLMSNLAEIGINTEVKTMTYTAMTAKWKKPETRGDIYTFYRSPETADPYSILDSQYSSKAYYNLTGYSNEEVDRLLAKAAQSNNQDERKEAYMRVQEIVAEEAPMIFAFQMQGLFAAKKCVKGIEFNPTRFEGWEFYPMYCEE